MFIFPYYYICYFFLVCARVWCLNDRNDDFFFLDLPTVNCMYSSDSTFDHQNETLQPNTKKAINLILIRCIFLIFFLKDASSIQFRSNAICTSSFQVWSTAIHEVSCTVTSKDQTFSLTTQAHLKLLILVWHLSLTRTTSSQ